MPQGHGDAKGTTALMQADAHGQAAFPPFDQSTFASQLLSLAIAGVALYLIVSKIALPRVGGVIEERQRIIDSDLMVAQKLKDEADDVLKAYEAELANARAQAQAIGLETRKKLNANAEAERKILEEQLAVKLAEAEKTIVATRTAAMGNIHDIASDAASAIVKQLAGVTPDSRAMDSSVEAWFKGGR